MKKVLSLLALVMSAQSAFAGYGTMTIGDSATLPDCGGTIKVSEANNNGTDEVIVSFSQVESCSNFDIVGLDGYKAKKLREAKAGTRYGTYPIPKRAIDPGLNSIQVVIHSDSGKHDDVINVMFFVSTPSSDPAPSTPSTGGAY